MVNLNPLLYRQIAWRSVSIAAAFVMNLVFARVLGAETNGWVLYQFAVLSLVIQLTGLSMETGIAYHTAKNDIPEGRLIGFSLLWTLLGGVAFLIGWTLYGWLIAPLTYPVTYALSFVMGNLLTGFGNAYCFSKFRFSIPGLSIVFTSAVVCLIAVFQHLRISDTINLTGLWFHSFLLQGAVLFLAILFSKNNSTVSFRVRAKDVKQIARYSVYAFVANLLFLLVTRIDYVFINQYRSDEELGNYAQVSRIAQLMFLLPAMVSTVLFPLTVKQSGETTRAAVKKMMVAIILINSSGCLLLLIGGKWLFPWLYGASFDKMYLAFVFLVPGIIALSVLHPLSAYYSGNKKIGLNIIGGLIALAVILPGDILFIPTYGINAAALVSSAGYCAYAAFAYWQFRKMMPPLNS